jgi:hypothetical protein
MKDYNDFQKFLDTLTFVTPNSRDKKHKIAFMGKKGDENKPHKYSNPNKTVVRTQAFVLCYYEYSQTVEWKSVYKNTKGFFINYSNKSYYIDL